MFDAFAFGVSIFCVWISIGILMKKHRFWHRFCCFYLRRVDFFVSKTLCQVYGYRLGFRWKIINFDQVFDAFTFGVSTRRRPAAHHRDVDPLNPQARLWSSGSTTCESPWKDSRSRAWVRIPRAALFRDLIMRLRKCWKIEKNDQNQRKSIFYFSELRGRGKSSARISKVKSTYLRILFFFSGSQNEAPTCVLQKFPPKINV